MAAPVFPGGPQGANFTDFRGANGLLQPNMNLQGNTQGLDAMRARVTSAAPSPWTQMQMGNLAQNNQWAQSSAAQNIGKQNLAMKAGMGTQGNPGNAEMNAWRGMQNNNSGMGDVASQLRQGQSDLINKDQVTKMAGLKDQVGNEVNALKPQEFNITNALAEKKAADTSKLANWQEQMKAYGASQMARAHIQSGKK